MSDETDTLTHALQILQSRIETSPEDFTSFGGRFFSLTSDLLQAERGDRPNGYWFMDAAEREMLRGVVRTLARQQFADSIVSALMRPKQEPNIAATRAQMATQYGTSAINSSYVSTALGTVTSALTTQQEQWRIEAERQRLMETLRDAGIAR